MFDWAGHFFLVVLYCPWCCDTALPITLVSYKFSLFWDTINSLISLSLSLSFSLSSLLQATYLHSHYSTSPFGLLRVRYSIFMYNNINAYVFMASYCGCVFKNYVCVHWSIQCSMQPILSVSVMSVNESIVYNNANAIHWVCHIWQFNSHMYTILPRNTDSLS